MAMARLLLAISLTCADCMQTQGEWQAAPGPSPKPAAVKTEDSVCYLKSGHFYGFHTDNLSEGSYKKLKNNMDALFAPFDYMWGVFSNRQYLRGLKVMHWGEEAKPKICDVTEIFKWSLVERGAPATQLKSTGEPKDRKAAETVLEGVGLQYSKENAWEMYRALRGVWATEVGVMIARAVKVGFREFPPDVFPELLGIEVQVMNAGCKGTLFCTAKIIMRRLLVAQVEKKFFLGMEELVPEEEKNGTDDAKKEGTDDEKKDDAKTEGTDAKTEGAKTGDAKKEDTDDPDDTEDDDDGGWFGRNHGNKTDEDGDTKSWLPSFW